MKEQKSNPTNTLLVLILALLIIYLFTKYDWVIYTSIGLGIIGVFSPFLSKIVDTLWMKIAWILSLIIPKIVLSVIFYLILTPIAFVSKFFNKDQLQLRKNKNSYFKEVDKTFSAEDFTKPW